jgi:SAM-dependent methyltransferase
MGPGTYPPRVSSEQPSGAFETGADAYDRHVGRYAPALARATGGALGLGPGQRLLDVGCGTGAGTGILAKVVGPENVSAVDPSETFLARCRERLPGSDTRRAGAEELPFADDGFDAVIAQLVVMFIAEPAVGVGEMRRVARPGGLVAASSWDFADGMPMLRAFWDAASAVAPDQVAAAGEGGLPRNATPGELTALWDGAGLNAVRVEELGVAADYADFDDLWAPFAAGAARSGRLVRSLPDDLREAVGREVWERLGRPSGKFTLSARAWCVVGTA